MSIKNNLHQPTRREPLLQPLIDRTHELGVVALRCQIELRLNAVEGRDHVRVRFVVDSGASFSFIGLEYAKSLHLPLPGPETEVVIPLRTALGLTAMRVRPGRIRGWWNEGLRGYPFDWPVLFRVGAPLAVPSILGLGGVVKTCRWTFDGQYSPESPYGSFTLDDAR